MIEHKPKRWQWDWKINIRFNVQVKIWRERRSRSCLFLFIMDPSHCPFLQKWGWSSSSHALNAFVKLSSPSCHTSSNVTGDQEGKGRWGFILWAVLWIVYAQPMPSSIDWHRLHPVSKHCCQFYSLTVRTLPSLGPLPALPGAGGGLALQGWSVKTPVAQ